MRTRVGRVSAGALANGRGASTSSPTSVLVDVELQRPVALAARFSMRPRSSQSCVPAMRIVAGKPMKAGSFAPPRARAR